MSDCNENALRGVGIDYIRRHNLNLILGAIKKFGPISRADLARLVNLSPPTVSSIVSYLEQRKLVRETELNNTIRGRPPRLIQYNENAGYIVGMEISYTKIKTTIATLLGNELHTIEEPRKRYIGVNDCIDQCISLLHQLSSHSNIQWNEILALSVAVPGIVNSDNGDVIIENDIRCAAIGEYASGAARDLDSFVIIDLCEGVGSAIMVNGQLLKGHNFAAGEIGYMCTDINSIGYASAEREYLENYFGLGAIRDKVLKELRRGRRSSLDVIALGKEHDITFDKLMNYAKQGDTLALEITSFVANGLAFAISNIAAVFDPDLVILGPNIEPGGEFLLKEVRHLIDEQIPFRPEVVQSTLGSQAILTGAIHTAIIEGEEKIINNDH